MSALPPLVAGWVTAEKLEILGKAGSPRLDRKPAVSGV